MQICDGCMLHNKRSILSNNDFCLFVVVVFLVELHHKQWNEIEAKYMKCVPLVFQRLRHEREANINSLLEVLTFLLGLE
jgi:hypothetical protein